MPQNRYDDTLEELAQTSPAASPPAPLNPYDTLIQEQEIGRTQRLRTSITQADAVPPDRAAESLRLSQETGLPVAVVDRHFDEIQKRARLTETPYQAVTKQTPALATWAAVPEHAAVAHDDLANLGFLEWLVTAPQRGFARGKSQIDYAGLRWKSLFQPLDQHEEDLLASYKQATTAGGALGAGESWFSTRGAIVGGAEQLPNLFGAALAGTRRAWQGAIAGATAGLAGGPFAELTVPAGFMGGLTSGMLAGAWEFTAKMEAAFAYDEFLDVRDEFGQPLDPQVAKVAALAVGAINGGLETVSFGAIARTIPGVKGLASLGSVAVKNGVKAALRSPTVRGALLEALKEYGGTLGVETLTEVAQRAVTILGRELSAGGPAGTVPGQLERGNINLFQQPRVENPDGSISTVDSVSANVDGREVLLSRVSPDGRHVTTEEAVAAYQQTGRHLGIFQTPEAATAFAERLHKDYERGAYDEPTTATTIAQDLVREGLSAVQAMALPIAAGPMLQFTGDAVRARRAQQGAQFFTVLAEGVANSKTYARSPAAVQDFLAKATKDGPIETVYQPLESWNTYWQSQGVDPADMAAEVIGGRDAYEQATKHGGDLAIPTARYAVKLAATKHNAFFVNELRLGPDEMNGREVKAFVEAQRALAAEPPPAAEPDVVREQVLERMVRAGIPRGTAETYADVYAAFQGTTAARTELGLTPEQIAAERPVTFTRPTDAGPLEAAGFRLAPGTVGPQAAPGATTAVSGAVAPAVAGAAPVVPAAAPAVRPGVESARGAAPIEPSTALSPAGEAAAPGPAAVAGPAPGEGPENAPGEQPGAHVGGPAEGRGDGGLVEPGGLPAAAARQFPTPPLDEVFDRRPLAENTARLTPELRRELTRILDELSTFPFVGRTWHWLGDTEAKTGNAAGGAADIIGGAAGASVYNDILALSPVNTATSGRRKGEAARQAHGTRAQVEAAIRKALETGDIHNNLAEGAVRVAERRNAGEWQDLTLDMTVLPPSWGEIAPPAITDALSAEIDDALEAANLLADETAISDLDLQIEGDTSFNIDEFEQSLFDDLEPPHPTADVMTTGPVEPRVDVLDTGEVQPRLPEAGAVRDVNVPTPELEAPFSLTAEIAKPRTTKERTLFQARAGGVRFTQDILPETRQELIGLLQDHPGFAQFPQYRALMNRFGLAFESEFKRSTVVKDLNAAPLPPSVSTVEDLVDVATGAVVATPRPRMMTHRELIAARREQQNRGGWTRRQAIARGEVESTFGQDREFNQTVYHGSPAIFDRFSLHAIGTGEGVQAYGWGLYFSSQREIADRYREALAGKPKEKALVWIPEVAAGMASEEVYAQGGLYTRLLEEGRKAPDSQQARMAQGFTELHSRIYWSPPGTAGIARVKEMLEKSIANFEGIAARGETFSGDASRDAYDLDNMKAALEVLNFYGDRMSVRAAEPRPGRTYTVELPTEADYLDWDKPASQQSPQVQAALTALGITWDALRVPSPMEAIALFSTEAVQALAREDIGIRETLREGYLYATTDNVTAWRQWYGKHQGLMLETGVIDPTGEQLYEELQQQLMVSGAHPELGVYGLVTRTQAAERASKALNAHGVAGIRYLDGFSRQTGAGTSNYVLFDEKLAQITEFDQGPVALTPENVTAWAQELQDRVGPELVAFDVRLLPDGDLSLDTIAVQRGANRGGLGGRVMQELTRFADLNGRRIVLSLADRGYSPVADSAATTSRSRLREFYKRFGFVENKGRTKNFRLSIYTSMYREPSLPGVVREFGQGPAAATPTFYSRLTRAVEDSKQPRAPGAQWKAAIKNAKIGISKDEFALAKLDELEDAKTYTKEDVLAYLAANTLTVVDVTLEGEGQIDETSLERLVDQQVEQREDEIRDRIADNFYAEGLNAEARYNEETELWDAYVGGDEYDTDFATEEAAQEAADDQRRVLEDEQVDEAVRQEINEIDRDEIEREIRGEMEQTGGVHYEEYTEPGKVEGSYREVFLTVPNVPASGRQFAVVKHPDRSYGFAVKTPDGSFIQDDAGNVRHFNTEDTALRVATQTYGARYGVTPATWRDGHSAYADIKNPIVRLRFDERTDTEGRRVLFLEEVQPPGKSEQQAMPPLLKKNWREIAFKWALRYAADNGFDVVAWTSGEQQAKRYTLEKVVDEIRYRQNKDGTYDATFWKEGRNLDRVEQIGATAAMMEDLVGGDIFARIKAGEGDAYQGEIEAELRKRGPAVDILNDEQATEAGYEFVNYNSYYLRYADGSIMGRWASRDAAEADMARQNADLEAGPQRVLSGEGLTVGGGGLKKLYNVDFKNVVQGLAAIKKHGGKVEPIDLGFSPGYKVIVGRTRDNVEQFHVLDQQTNFFVGEVYKTREEAEDVAAEKSKTATVTVPGLELTEDMKTALEGGQALFQTTPEKPTPDTPYGPRDLFGDPVGPGPIIRAGPVEEGQPAGIFPTQTALVTMAERQLGAVQVQAPEDAAAALVRLGKGAQERFDGLVVDVQGRPLAIVGSYKGGIAHANLQPAIMLAEAVQVPGGVAIWFAHNHPSGRASLSVDDYRTNNELARMFEGSGLETKGTIAIGSANEDGSHDWEHTDGQSGVVPAGQAPETVTVPVVERELTATGKLGPSIDTPAEALSELPAVAGGQFGAILTDAQHRPIGFLPITPEQAASLRTGPRLQALARSLSLSAPAGVFIYAPETSQKTAAINLANAFHARDVPVLDIVVRKQSAKLNGWLAAGQAGNFAQDRPDDRERRGSIRFGPGRQVLISLFERADPTTVLHEFGHLFLEQFLELADRVAAVPADQRSAPQQQYLADQATLAAWLTDEDHVGPGLSVKQHEQFARGFEAYLFEGKSPSVGLERVFARARAWMIRAYRALRNLNVELTPEVRAVFDRLIATDREIAAAEARRGPPALFTTAESAGMSPTEFALYRTTLEAAHRTATERLEVKLLAEVQREQTAQWKATRDEVEAQVSAAVYEKPEYRATYAMQFGTHPNGDPLTEGDSPPRKLSREILVARFGAERLKRLPKPYLYTVHGGLDPEIVASMFGFTSADAMLTAVEQAPPMRAVIEHETNRIMLEVHGSLLLDGTLPDAAQAAVANEDLESVVRAELKALGQLRRTVAPFLRAERLQQAEAERERAYERRWFEAEAKLKQAQAAGAAQADIDDLEQEVSSLKKKARGGAAAIRAGIPPHDLLVSTARDRLARMPIRNIRPATFWTAARQASQQAVERAARQDFDGAIVAKQQELINLALYREAETQLEAVAARTRFAQSLSKGATRKRIGLAGGSYLDQIDGILDRYEFANVPQRTLDRRASLRNFVAGLEAQGLPVDLPEAVLDESRRKNYQELTLEEFLDVTDALRQLAHLAALKNRLLTAKDEREFAAVRDAVVASIRTHATTTKRPLEFSPGDEKWRRVNDFFASHRKMADIVQALDGYVDGGAFWSAFMLPINEAADREETRKQEAATAFGKLFDRYYPGAELGRLGEKVHIAAINGSLSKEARLAVALNWGNESSRQRLLNDPDRRWTEDQVTAILDTLDKRDWDFVQALFDYVNSFWTEIAEKQERVVGIAPEKVAAVPIETKFGTYAGGYYHLAYDTRLSVRAAQHEAAGQAKLSTGAAYVRATTKRGHTEARASNVHLSVRLELGVAFEHIEAVLHDLTHHEMLIDVTRILRDSQVSRAILETHGDILYKQLARGLEDVAIGSTPAPKNMLDAAANYMRTGTQIAGLGWNLWTAAQQPLGLFNGMARVGPKWVARGITRWLRDAAHLENTLGWITSVSPMMKNRSDTATQDLAELKRSLRQPGGWFDRLVKKATGDKFGQQAILDSYLWHIGVMQRVADVPVWLGQYEKSMAGGETEARAIAIADQAVLDSQGGGQVKDLAQLQRGGPIARLYMTFYSYGNTVFNATAREVGRTSFKNPAEVGTFLGHLSLLYIMPAVATIALSRAFGTTDGDDDPGWAFAEDVGREILATTLNTLVLVRELGGLAREGVRGYAGPAGATVVNLLYNLGTQIKQGEADEALARAANQVAGRVFRYPAAQVQRTVDGWIALEEGRTKNPFALLFGPDRAKAQ